MGNIHFFYFLDPYSIVMIFHCLIGDPLLGVHVHSLVAVSLTIIDEWVPWDCVSIQLGALSLGGLQMHLLLQ